MAYVCTQFLGMTFVQILFAYLLKCCFYSEKTNVRFSVGPGRNSGRLGPPNAASGMRKKNEAVFVYIKSDVCDL